MQGEQADCVMTDPPYGMGLDANFADIHSSRSTVALGGGKQRSHNNYDKVLGDNGDFDFTNIAYIWEFAPEVFLWGADYYIDSVPVRPEWDRVRFGRSIYTPAQIYSGNKGEITQC